MLCQVRAVRLLLKVGLMPRFGGWDTAPLMTERATGLGAAS